MRPGSRGRPSSRQLGVGSDRHGGPVPVWHRHKPLTGWRHPAMIFAGIFMMPFVSGPVGPRIPEIALTKRRAFNALSFAAMTVFLRVFRCTPWASCWSCSWAGFQHLRVVSGFIVLYTPGRIDFGDYNEVIQFFLIVFGSSLWYSWD